MDRFEYGYAPQALATLVLAMGLSGQARAQLDAGARGADAAAATSVVPLPIRIEHALLLSLVPDHGLAQGAGINGFVLVGPVELGVSGAGEIKIFGYSRTQFALHAGGRMRVGRTEFDLAATVGSASMRNDSDQFLDDDPGVQGSLYFAGARTGVTLPVFVSKRGQIRLGILLALSYELDLNSRLVTYTYQVEDEWFGNNSYEETATRRLGTQRVGMQAAFVFGLD